MCLFVIRLVVYLGPFPWDVLLSSLLRTYWLLFLLMLILMWFLFIF